VRLRREDGAVAVEFALILPIIVVILFATTEFGIAMAKWEDYESAAREGARYAAVRCQPRRAGDPVAGPCTKSMIVAAINAASSDLALTDASVMVGFGGAAETPGDYDCALHPGQPVSVSWQQTFTFQVPLLSIAPRVRTIKGVFRCE
jgi:Flp pilus assembly protein TadG